MTSTERIHVLLIEDDPGNQQMIEVLLGGVSHTSFHLERAGSLSVGLGRLGREGIDVVLLDLNLPDSEGLETCVTLHARAPGVPIVVLTGIDDEELAFEAVQRGAQDYLVKGRIDRNLLARSLRYAIGRMKAQERQRQADERLRLVTEQFPAILWTTDRQLRFTTSSGTGLLVLALQPNQVVGMSLFDYFETKNPDFLPIAAHRRAIAGESVSFDFDWRGQSFHAHVEPLRDAAGRIIGVVGVALNVSDRRRMEHSIDAARHIQQTLFPHGAPQVPGFDIAGAVYSADETAGDYYDFIPMPNGYQGMVVGDVTGHGLGPALLMTELRAYLRPLAMTREDVGEILTLANRFITADLEDHHFVTVFFARLDYRARSVAYAGAGHCGFLLNSTGETSRLDSTGFPLGLLSEIQIAASQPMELQAGDIMLLITDGFQEALSPEQELFGLERVLDAVMEHREESAAMIIENLYRTARAFSASVPQRDDMSAIVVKCTPEP